MRKKVIFASICCFFLHVIISNHFNGWFCTDTDGYLLHAATFAGRDWSDAARNSTMFYAWGFGFVISPLFMLFDNILEITKGIAIINSLLCAMTIPLFVSLGRKLFKDIKESTIIGASFVASLYTSFFLYSVLSLAEMLIYFLYVLMIWLVYRYMETERWYWLLLGGVCCGYIYCTHHRMLGLVIAYAILVIILSLRNKNTKALFALVPLGMTFLLDNCVNEYLMSNEGMISQYTANTYESVGGQVKNLMTLNGMLSFVQNFLGEIWYMLIGTLLVAGIAILYIVRMIGNDCKKKSLLDNTVFGGYLLLNTILTIAISSIFFVRTSVTYPRIDVIFYGRYFECTIVIFLFMGLLILNKIRESSEIKKM